MRVLPLLLSFLFLSSVAAFASEPDWQAVEKVFGRKGTVQGNVFKVTFPRSDLKVRVGKVPVSPGLALTSWAAFRDEENGTAVMGDLVLTENEVTPVMKQLQAAGIWVTALHNHLLGESPRVMYMHYGGRGDKVAVAGSLMRVLKLTHTPLGTPVAEKPSKTKPDWSKVEAIIGKAGQTKSSIATFSYPRAEPVTEMGMDIPPVMGLATAINIEMLGNKAVAAGDFVLTADEVNPVISALSEHGITVTAIHNHMLFETPRLFFMHIWGYGEPEKLARGIKAALEKVKIKGM
jgi:hypothetical protein